MKVTLDISFDSNTNPKYPYEVLEKIAVALRHEIDNGEGIAPEDDCTKSIIITDEKTDSTIEYDCYTGKIQTL
jgi:hypothetical protein